MKFSDLPAWSKRAAEWAADYYQTLRDRPVRPRVAPGDILSQLPKSPPEAPQEMSRIIADFEAIVPDAMTHWQHPRFFAYFPSNTAPAVVLAEQYIAAMSAQCMLWQTSPAATEIEISMIDWMRQAFGLPDHFKGLIQDSATTSTLCAVLTMRERALRWTGLTEGLSDQPRLRIYASAETHSSIDKAVRLSGIGQDNLVKVPVRFDRSMDPDKLHEAINADRDRGFLPAGVVICIGGTATGASDNVDDIIEVAKAEDLYTHVDAAWAGSAMICEELRPLWAGVESADSIVVNAHKWLGASFDCAIQFLADPAPQINTVGLRPSYLETAGHEDVVNFSEWTIPLGRRFRALKLWFLLRAHGLDDLRTRIRNHVAWAKEAELAIAALPDMQIVTENRLALFTFRFAPEGHDADKITATLLEAINADGRIYLTQTILDEGYVIRFTVGQFDTTHDDVKLAIDVIAEIAAKIV